MLIALISDIHGNLPALKTVLQDINRANVQQTWCLGDLIGYIPFPNECIGMIRKNASASIVGNYDQKVIQFKNGKLKIMGNVDHLKELLNLVGDPISERPILTKNEKQQMFSDFLSDDFLDI